MRDRSRWTVIWIVLSLPPAHALDASVYTVYVASWSIRFAAELGRRRQSMEIFARGADSLAVTARDGPVLDCRLYSRSVSGVAEDSACPSSSCVISTFYLAARPHMVALDR